MNRPAVIERLRRMVTRNPDGRGAYLGDGCARGEPIRALELADALEASSASAQWDRFIERLNEVQPIKDGTHKNLLGSIAIYRRIFLEANT